MSIPQSTPTETVIIGGGLAGLAAAATLTAEGIQVTLVESRNRLGGRASSFDDPVTGDRIDNCQHVSMGCCTNLRHFCRLIGTQDLFRTEDELNFIGPDGRHSRLSSSPLPAPLHIWPAFRKLSFLSRSDRRQLTRGLFLLARTTTETLQGQSFQAWLNAQRQSREVIDRFWGVVLVSALSESLDRIDAALARKVFVDSFLAHRDGWLVQIPTAPLDEVFGTRVCEWLQARGSRVLQQSPAAALHLDGQHVSSVRLKDGRSLVGSEFILALPHFRIRDLVPSGVEEGSLARIEQIESAPISSVHLWYDQPITELPHAVLIDRLGQWMFNRNRLWPQLSRTGEYGVQVVISASRNVEELGRDATVSAVHRELCDIWPAAGESRLLKSRLITERRAVFSPTPGCDALRPPQQSSIPNLQFAGDWTQTGWPSTMESAVRSGFLAAENVLQRLGRPRRLLQPDLPVSWLPRLVFRLS